MCGIVGYIGNDAKGQKVVLEGLLKLEYRGYDSCGIAKVNNNEINITKAVGFVSNLADKVSKEETNLSIGHTRWATHGVPTNANSHPHVSYTEKFVIVHNGVINNFQELKKKYLSDVIFRSETDTEVIACLLEKTSEKESDILKILSEVFPKLEGSYACAILEKNNLNKMYVAKNKSPLLIGKGDGFNVVSSDALAVSGYTEIFYEINDSEIAEITSEEVKIYDFSLNSINRDFKKIKIDMSEADMGSFDTYMEKEIHEQPQVVTKIMNTYLSNNKIQINQNIVNEIKNADAIYIIASGTSYHAGLIAKNYFNKYANKLVEVFIASEFDENTYTFAKNPIYIIISQSGETADARAALQIINARGHKTICLTNTEGSTLARESTYNLLLYAGREISVASTKAYTAQVLLLYFLALSQIEKIDDDLTNNIFKLVNVMNDSLENKNDIKNLTYNLFKDQYHTIFLGRSKLYNLTQEAALKLKEITYIVAESYPAGEMKHGPISLIQDKLPVIVLVDQNHEGHIRSNIQEAKARGANIVTIASKNVETEEDNIVVPFIHEDLTILTMVIPLQLIAYFETLNRGLPVDKPRNLAKSVTVE